MRWHGVAWHGISMRSQAGFSGRRFDRLMLRYEIFVHRKKDRYLMRDVSLQTVFAKYNSTAQHSTHSFEGNVRIHGENPSNSAYEYTCKIQ